MKIGIVCSKFNDRYTDALLASTLAALDGHQTTAVRVPGAFEIPLALLRLAKKKGARWDALIALGVIWKGQTDHADLIASQVAEACMGLSLEFEIPIAFEVLTVSTEAQAKERCMGKKLNRGAEAARTALEMAALKI